MAGQHYVAILALVAAATCAQLAAAFPSSAVETPRNISDAHSALSSLSTEGMSVSRRKLLGTAIPIDMTVILLYASDVQGGYNSPCVQMVDRAAAYKPRAINFMTTYYFADYNGDYVMDALGWKSSPDDTSFRTLTWSDTYAISKGLSFCMKHAANKGFYIASHIHLDEGLGKNTWRNSLIYDPTTKYGSLSYMEGVVKPVAQAVKDANWRKRDTYFALQAEMGATLFYYPKQYRSMYYAVKKILGANGTPSKKIKVGININWQKICGCPGNLMDSANYLGDLSGQFDSVKKQIDVGEVQKLFKTVDFIGISAYAGLPQNLSPDDLETSMKTVDQELALFGMSLKGLKKEIVLSEYGLGGAMSGDGNTVAASSANVAASPYWGIGGVYQSWRDPWQKSDNRQYLENFYRVTAQWAQRGGGPNYVVSAIFLWSITSYDALGIHYWSSSSSGTYRNPTVASTVLSYNEGLRGSGR